MKKRILLSLLFVLMLFVVTGCSKENDASNSSNLHKLEFVDMRYNAPKNFSKKEPVNIDNDKILNYFFAEDSTKNIKLLYYKNKKEGFIVDDSKYEVKEINGIKWKVIREDDMDDVVYDTYVYEYGNDLYVVELNAVNKYEEEFATFMKGISFK